MLCHPLFRAEGAAFCREQPLLDAPLRRAGSVGIRHICKCGSGRRFRSPGILPQQQCQRAAVCGDGRACGQQTFQDRTGGQLINAQTDGTHCGSAACHGQRRACAQLVQGEHGDDVGKPQLDAGQGDDQGQGKQPLQRAQPQRQRR